MLNRLKTKGAIVTFALMATILPACTNQLEANRPASEPGNVTTEEVVDNTNELIGQTVTIRSEPIRKVDPNAFTVNDEQFFGSEPIIVVNASGQPFTLPENDTEVQVTGEVRNLVVADLNREYDLDLEPDLYVDYENRPAIIAQSIAPAPEPGEISANPSQYYGRTLAVSGEVENVYGANTFTLDEDQLFGGEDLLVIVRNAQGVSTPVEVDQTVATTGVLREFVVAELEREYNFNWDEGLVRQLEAEYKTRPVLVVDRVYQSAIPDAAK
ncbi:MAG: hypothetical protein MUD14_27490 [Hydrococcus sp. Prado102]|jgi:hypothetical protein|nr:hypothetical protein [Hydrococcus sp. Prado102]